MLIMNKKFLYFFVPLLTLSIFFSGCNMDLLDAPVVDQLSGSSSKTLLPPRGVKASHGQKRKVVLSWNPAAGAAYYNIYSAETPFELPVLCGETSDSVPSFTVEEYASSEKYYYITTISYSGEESDFSLYAYGTTLAKPVITNVVSDTNGTASSVSWWMDNCTESTYSDNVCFEIEVESDDSGKETKSAQVNRSNGDCRAFSALVVGLRPGKTYRFKVIACTLDNSRDTESSDSFSSDMAHSLSPEAPGDLSASCGIEKDRVTLSWNIPPFAETKESGGTYAKCPVSFKILRKEKDADDRSWVTIAPYIGIYNKSSGIRFNCGNNTSSSGSVLSVEKYDGTDAEINPEFAAYIPGSRLTYTDNSGIVRGKQYVYKVQAYTDGEDSKFVPVSSELSSACTEGYPLASALFSANADYRVAEGKYDNISVSFMLDFNESGGQYAYLLTSVRTPFIGSSGAEKLEQIFDSLASLDSYRKNFSGQELTQEEGYHEYAVYIVKPGTEAVPSNPGSDPDCYDKITAPNRITVTDDISKKPEIKNFTVKDGYAGKFVLSWIYDANCNYTVKWEDQASGVSETKALDAGEITVQGTLATYEHTADSGVSRYYSLIANKEGIEVAKAFEDEENAPVLSKTLGTAQVSVSPADYDKITLTWPSVQMAKSGSYVVSAKYEGEASELTASNTEISEENGIVTCTITKPSGFDDAKVSGKNIKLSVKAVSEKRSGESTTSTTVDACTMGPALLDVRAGNIKTDEIIISWKEIPGADGYLIHRVRYEDGYAQNFVPQTDTYYYHDGKIDSINEKRASVSVSNGRITLSDKYCEADDATSSYESNQSMISWGLPFGYIVLPLKKGGSDSDFEFDGLKACSSSNFEYKNLSGIKSAAYGWGLAVRAYKSESSSTQEISWEQPYNKNYQPVLYRRISGYNGEWEKVDANIPSGATSASYKPEEISEAYEYAVAYGRTKQSIDVPDDMPGSLLNDTGKGLSAPETNYDYTGLVPEKKNKGYLLAVDFAAQYGGTLSGDGTYIKDGNYYSEKVRWNEWDYNKRSIGPDSAEIYIRNYNLSDQWIKVADLDKDMHFCGQNTCILNTNVTGESGDVAIYLSPKTLASASNPVTEGLLQVLRDAKHYYSITLTRGAVSESQGKDGEYYAYRQISPIELVRAAMIQMSAVMNGVGKLDTETESGEGSVRGSYIFTHQSTMNMGKDYKYSISNYSSALNTKCGKKVYSFQISVPNGSIVKRDQLGVGGYPKSFNSTTVNISPIDSLNTLESYSGSITFEMSGYTSASFSCKGETISINNNAENRRKWIPFKLHGDDTDYSESSAYGWWPND